MINEEKENLSFDPEILREKYLLERDKRVRADGNDQYVEVKGDFSYFVEDPYVTESISSCLLYTSPSPRDATLSRMPSSA